MKLSWSFRRSGNALHGKRRDHACAVGDGRALHGFHLERIHGLSELLRYVDGMSVFDAGCDRGLIPFAFAMSGVRLVHGCGRDAEGVAATREIFDEVDIRSHFEVVDVAQGDKAIASAFGFDYHPKYDVMLFPSLDYIDANTMPRDAVAGLVRSLLARTKTFFVHRMTSTADVDASVERVLEASGLNRVYFTTLISTAGAISVWECMPL